MPWCDYKCSITEESARHACGQTLHAMSSHSPDILKRHATQAMPLAFFAMHEKKEGTETISYLSHYTRLRSWFYSENLKVFLSNNYNNFFDGWYTLKKWMIHRIMRVAWCEVYRPFFRGIPPSTKKLLQLVLII